LISKFVSKCNVYCYATDRENAVLVGKHESLESQLLSIASKPAQPPTVIMAQPAPSRTPPRSPSRSPIADRRVGAAGAAGAAGLGLSDVMEDVRSSVVSLPAAAAAAGVSATLAMELEEARAEMAKSKAAADEAKATARAEARSEAEEEVTRLREANAQLSAAAEDTRAKTVAAKQLELQERERQGWHFPRTLFCSQNTVQLMTARSANPV
jgi:hypothetical protein